jgi:hypothetical protein
MAYVCERCIEQYELTPSAFTCIGACEIHGPVKGQWGKTHVVWTAEIKRFLVSPDSPIMHRSCVLGNLNAILKSCYCGVPHFVWPASPWTNLPRTPCKSTPLNADRKEPL